VADFAPADEGPPDPNAGGDIWFMRAIGKYVNGPLYPHRAAREAAGYPTGWTGFQGHTPVLPNDNPGGDFFTIEDRWRIAIPAWDRYIWNVFPDSYHQHV